MNELEQAGFMQAQSMNKDPAFQAPINQYGSSIVLLTNPQNELNRLVMTLKSVIKDDKGKIHQAGEPLLNDTGINSVIGQVQSIVNQVTIMSNLEKDHIPLLVDYLGDTLARDLMVNRRAYNIKDISARDKIYFSALTTAFVCMRRAKDEGDRRFWKGSQQEITTRVEGGKNKNNWLTKAMGWQK